MVKLFRSYAERTCNDALTRLSAMTDVQLVGTQSDDLPQQHAERPDVTVSRVDAVTNRLNRHPLERQAPARQLTVLVSSVDDSSKPKVAHFHRLVVAQQHVAGRQITMHKVAFRQVLLTA